MAFQSGDPIWVPNPDGEGRLAATFLAPGEPNEAKVDPKLGVPRDIAWISYAEGNLESTTAPLFYREISPRKQ